MTLRKALRRAQQIANRTGRPVTVLCFPPGRRRRNPSDTEQWIAEQTARGMRDPESRSFLPAPRRAPTAAGPGSFLEVQEAEALMRRERITFLDVTHKSVEELASTIVHHAGLTRRLF